MSFRKIFSALFIYLGLACAVGAQTGMPGIGPSGSWPYGPFIFDPLTSPTIACVATTNNCFSRPTSQYVGSWDGTTWRPLGLGDGILVTISGVPTTLAAAFTGGFVTTAQLNAALVPYLTSANATLTYVPLTRTITAGTGLTGGGALSSNQTLSVAANGVVNSLLAQAPALTVKANTSGVPANVSDVTTSALLDSTIGSTQGSIIYRNSTTWVPLAPGTNGQYLQSTGAASNPQWVSAPITSFPQGRLTLTSATPVLSSSVNFAATVFYTPYNGNNIPIWNGVGFASTTFAEVSQTLSDTTKSPAAAVANNVYDIFGWSDSGTFRATRGPAWSVGGGSNLTRGTGAGSTALTQVNGVLTNSFSITNGPAAGFGTYLGTIATNNPVTGTVSLTIASPAVFTLAGHTYQVNQPVVFTTAGTLPTGITAGTTYYVITAGYGNGVFEVSATPGGSAVNTSGTQSGPHTSTPAVGVSMNYGSVLSGGGFAALGVWNEYNRVSVSARVLDSTTSWSYSSPTIRAANASAGNRIYFISGQAEDGNFLDYQCVAQNSIANITFNTAVGVNSVTSFSPDSAVADSSSAASGSIASLTAIYSAQPIMGENYFQALESAASGASYTILSGSVPNGEMLKGQFRM